MRALRFHEFGKIDVLRLDNDVPIPEPGPNQVLVRVAGAGLNPVDWKIRENLYPAFAPNDLPAIMGQEFSGTVEKLGPGASGFVVGDEVIGSAKGSCADYVVANSAMMAPKPYSMGLVYAAGIPVAGVTAWQALFDNGGLQTGQRVFIQSAAGGVGTFAVQFADWKDTYVAGTASASNHALLRELGMDLPIDYKTTQYDKELKDFDLAVETQHDSMAKTFSILREGGTLVSLVGPGEAPEGKRIVSMSGNVTRAGLEQIVALIDGGSVVPVIAKALPFEQAVELYRELEAGHTVGKLILDMS